MSVSIDTFYHLQICGMCTLQPTRFKHVLALGARHFGAGGACFSHAPAAQRQSAQTITAASVRCPCNERYDSSSGDARNFRMTLGVASFLLGIP